MSEVANIKFDALSALGLTIPAASMDYVNDKKQFQLHHLLTEQRHPKTWSLSRTAREDTEEALRALLTVDEDVSEKLEQVAGGKDVSRVGTSREYPHISPLR